VADALTRLWPFTSELFDADDIDRAAAEAGIGPVPGALATAWNRTVDEVLAAATLTRPPAANYAWHGKQGRHSEHLGYLLAEMQSLHRAHPGATW
jgi:ring-1,2-phenylacetyl-CoA epoxidase subunit PaaC